MGKIITQKDVDCLTQFSKQFFVKILLKNNKMQTIDELQGELTSGNYNIDGNSNIRRTCNLTFYVKDKSYYIDQKSKIWIDKIVDIQIGIYYIKTKEILWYPLGLYVFNDNGFQFDDTTRSLNVSCLDLMSTLTGTRGGTLRGLATQIPRNSNVGDVIRNTIIQLGNINKYIIVEHSNSSYRILPYDLEFSTGATVYDILDKIAKIFSNIEFFFDTDGTFIWREIPKATNDMIIFDDTLLNKLIISESIERKFEDIANAIEVWGKDDVSARLLLVDKLPNIQNSDYDYLVNSDSVYAVKVDNSKILSDTDFIWKICSGSDYSLITTKALCLDRCKYEMYLGAALNDKLRLTTAIIPWLEPNMKFSYTHKSDLVKSDYLIKSMQFDFTFKTCSIEAIKFNPIYSWL